VVFAEQSLIVSNSCVF